MNKTVFMYASSSICVAHAFCNLFFSECILTVWHGWSQPVWKLSGATRDNIFARKCQKKVMWTCLEKPEALQRQDFQTLLNKQTCEDPALIKKKNIQKKHPTWTGVCVCVFVRWSVSQRGTCQKQLRLHCRKEDRGKEDHKQCEVCWQLMEQMHQQDAPCESGEQKWKRWRPAMLNVVN